MLALGGMIDELYDPAFAVELEIVCSVSASIRTAAFDRMHEART